MMNIISELRVNELAYERQALIWRMEQQAQAEAAEAARQRMQMRLEAMLEKAEQERAEQEWEDFKAADSERVQEEEAEFEASRRKLVPDEALARLRALLESESMRRQWEEEDDEKAVSRRVRDEVFAASRHWLMEDELVPLPCEAEEEDDEVPEWLLKYPWAAELAAAKAYAKRVAAEAAAEPPEMINWAEVKREFEEEEALHAIWDVENAKVQMEAGVGEED
jgi:hypothetical protein